MFAHPPGLAPADSFLPPVRRGRTAGCDSLPTRGEGLGRAYGCDGVVNGRAGHGGFGFVVDERLVAGGLDDTINTVDRLLPGPTIEHFTRQTAGSATAAPSFIHCGIQGLSHQSLIRPRAERDHSTRFGQPDPLPAPRLINPFSGPICEGPRIRDWRLCSTP